MVTQPSAGAGSGLLPRDIDFLMARAHTPEWIERSGYSRQGGKKSAALVIPIYGLEGEMVGKVLRRDVPRIVDGKPVKYESTTGGRNRLHVHPTQTGLLENPDVPLVITEGVIKANAAALRGIPCVGLNGVYGWLSRNKSNGSTPLIDWRYVALKNKVTGRGRKVYLCFDSDWRTNTQVCRALAELGELLGGRGAEVCVIDLPPGSDGSTVGLDDWLKANPTAGAAQLLRLATPDLPEPESQRKKTQAELLIATTLESGAELFHSGDTGYVTVPVESHRETHRIRSKGFRLWLGLQFFQATKGGAPGGQGMQDAIDALEARAIYTGEERPVYTRLAGFEGRIYVDLCDDEWRAVEISPDGVRVVSDPPVRFVRHGGMLPLPQPDLTGVIDDLLPFLNVEAKADFHRIVGFILGCYHPEGPYVFLALCSQQGSAKSFTARVVRSQIDPNENMLKTEAPETVRDLMITVSKNWLPVFDNLGGMSKRIANAFCGISTGGGQSFRTLYENDEETTFSFRRPVMFTSISDVMATKPDLMQRTMQVSLPFIPDERRQDEKTLLQAFETARPKILGAIYKAVSTALRDLPTVKLSKVPRMADFAYWVTAAESAFGWERETILTAYNGCQAEADAIALEAVPVGEPILLFMEHRTEWRGTASALLGALEGRNTGTMDLTRSDKWPANDSALSRQIGTVMSNLRASGIEVKFTREGKARTRTIHLKRL